MVLLKSQSLPLGSAAPDFNLISVDGKSYQLKSFHGAKALVVLFICNHCPYVQAIEDRLIQLAHDYVAKGVQVVGICSNDPTDYPDDAPAALLKRWREKKYQFPYLIDETQAVAKRYAAICTPELYVYDQKQNLAYHGRLDDAWDQPQKVQRYDLREALDALLRGEPPATAQIPSMGCSIKWKK